MKKTILFSFLFMFSLFSSALFAESANLSTATFSVEKMTCATCPIAVSKAMKRVNGVKDVEVNLEKKMAVVTYDSELTKAKAIGDASTNVGFPATLEKNES